MRSLAILALIISAIPTAGSAQTVECRTIPKATDRLACYDRLTPPMAVQKPTSAAAATPAQQTPAAGSATPLADTLAIENARLSSKLKSICRGC